MDSNRGRRGETDFSTAENAGSRGSDDRRLQVGGRGSRTEAPQDDCGRRESYGKPGHKLQGYKRVQESGLRHTARPRRREETQTGGPELAPRNSALTLPSPI